MPRHPCFSAAQLETVARALGHTEHGLTGSEIEHLLTQVRLSDPGPITKWQRIFNAFVERQNTSQSGDRVLAFIAAALAPARYAGRQEVFDTRRRAVNVALLFSGLEFGEDGKFHRCDMATTLGEAERRADRLRTALRQRGVEEDILVFCRAELLQDNYFHAVLEATKGVAAKIRQRTGLLSDGAVLAQEAFGGTEPKLRINPLRDKTEEGEQRGFVNLLTGFFGTFRNPVAHAPRVEWPVTEQDALDLLSLASYAVRRIKKASHHP